MCPFGTPNAHRLTYDSELLLPVEARSKSVGHSWAIFGLIIFCISTTLIFGIILWLQIQEMPQHGTEIPDTIIFELKLEALSDRTSLYASASKYVTLSEDFFPMHQSSVIVETYVDGGEQYSLFCYYVTPNKSSPNDKLSPEDIDPLLCTHIIVFFASVEKNKINFTDGTVAKVVVELKQKNPKLKVLLSVNSFNSVDQSFGTTVANKTRRTEFIKSAMQLISEYSLDGIDLDWEFPAWPPSRDTISQRYQFVQLLKEMRDQFESKFLITVAVAAPLPIIEQSYDIPAIAKYVDFVNVMCYDYHTFVWYFPFIGPNAPLYASSKDFDYLLTLNVNYTIYAWHTGGMPKKKIILGMPIYGHSWTLENSEDHDYGAIATGFGSIGEGGFVSYREVCNFTQRKYAKTIFDGETRVPYAYHEKEWISFDNIQSLSYKAEYVTEQGLGGAMIFSLNQDDFDASVCGYVKKFPLVNRVKQVLKYDDTGTE